MKQCTKCNELKSLDLFAKDKYKKDGHRSDCKACYSIYDRLKYNRNPEQERQRVQAYRKNNVEKVKASNRNTKLKRAYGITQEQFIEMSIKQDNKCACCAKETKLVVDHCHTNGNIRELLCNNCNTALGLLNEDNTIIQSLSNYLRKHNGNF
jgi:hypothetical protein